MMMSAIVHMYVCADCVLQWLKNNENLSMHMYKLRISKHAHSMECCAELL